MDQFLENCHLLILPVHGYSTSFTFFNVCQYILVIFSKYVLLTFIRLLPRYLTLFTTIVNGISPLHLLLLQNVIDFCTVISFIQPSC